MNSAQHLQQRGNILNLISVDAQRRAVVYSKPLNLYRITRWRCKSKICIVLGIHFTRQDLLAKKRPIPLHLIMFLGVYSIGVTSNFALVMRCAIQPHSACAEWSVQWRFRSLHPPRPWRWSTSWSCKYWSVLPPWSNWFTKSSTAEDANSLGLFEVTWRSLGFVDPPPSMHPVDVSA